MLVDSLVCKTGSEVRGALGEYTALKGWLAPLWLLLLAETGLFVYEGQSASNVAGSVAAFLARKTGNYAKGLLSQYKGNGLRCSLSKL